MLKKNDNSGAALKCFICTSTLLLLFCLLIFIRDFNAFNDSFIGFINSFLLAFYFMNIGFYLTPPWGIMLLYTHYTMGFVLLQVVLLSKNSMIITSVVFGVSVGLIVGFYISLRIKNSNEDRKTSNEKR